jgi:hypothetical protein
MIARIAAVQAAAVYMDLERSLDKRFPLSARLLQSEQQLPYSPKPFFQATRRGSTGAGT